jgi:hypothetical protein
VVKRIELAGEQRAELQRVVAAASSDLDQWVVRVARGFCGVGLVGSARGALLGGAGSHDRRLGRR